MRRFLVISLSISAGSVFRFAFLSALQTISYGCCANCKIKTDYNVLRKNKLQQIPKRKHCRIIPPFRKPFSFSRFARLIGDAKQRTSTKLIMRWRKETTTSTDSPWLGSTVSISFWKRKMFRKSNEVYSSFSLTCGEVAHAKSGSKPPHAIMRLSTLCEIICRVLVIKISFSGALTVSRTVLVLWLKSHVITCNIRRYFAQAKKYLRQAWMSVSIENSRSLRSRWWIADHLKSGMRKAGGVGPVLNTWEAVLLVLVLDGRFSVRWDSPSSSPFTEDVPSSSLISGSMSVSPLMDGKSGLCGKLPPYTLLSSRRKSS